MAMLNPDRLKEIIAIRGRKLDDLANKIGVTKQAISKYTNGKSMPSHDILNKLLIELNISSIYLTSEKPSNKGLTSPLFFRANSSTTKTAKCFASIVSGWGYEIGDALGAASQDSQLEVPKGLGACEAALYLRKKWGLGTTPIDNLISLLESHGFLIYVVDASEINTDAYSQIVNGIPIIVINRNKGTAVRQRFSVAHELGHLFLHKNISNTEFKLKNKDYEAEASVFANEFLLPTVNYDSFLNSRSINDLLLLKERWKISLAAMVYHCKQQKLITEIEAKRYQVQFSKKWGRMAEPFDDTIESECPSMLSAQIKAMVYDQQSFERFISNLHLPVDEVESLTVLPSGYLQKFMVSMEKSASDGFEQLSLFGLEA